MRFLVRAALVCGAISLSQCFDLPEVEPPEDEVEAQAVPDPPGPEPELPPAEPVSYVRAPAPGSEAPLNLRWMWIGIEPAPEPMPERFGLVSELSAIQAEVSAFRSSAVLLRLPEFRGPCRPLCPGARYGLELASGVPVAGAAFIQTATVVDHLPPVLTATRTFVYAGDWIVDVDANEPIVAHAEAQDRNGNRFALGSVPMAGAQIRLQPEAPLPPERELQITVFVEDLAGNPGPTLQFLRSTPPAVSVRMRELVSTPLRDWGSAEEGQVPFDAWPGSGPVTSSDEWIELVNEGSHPILLDRSGLELRVLDSSPTITPVTGAPGLFFGAGGNRAGWWPGEALVVRPRGDMAQRELTIELWSGLRLLDHILIGSAEGADHPGGAPPDAEHEALGRDAYGRLRWCTPTPGDPLPSSDCLE